ncbi:MAG: type II toxin-antitoxin system RelE/ParE family toxin [Pseudomonadota bacterium]
MTDTGHTVVQTPTFLAAAKRIGMSDEERERAVLIIAASPKAGDVIEGTGGVRKVRIARDGGGKSGGYRVFTFYGGGDVPVFLFTVISKAKDANLSKATRNELRAVVEGIADAYRTDVRQAVAKGP